MRERKLITTKEAGSYNNEGLTLEYYLTSKKSEETENMIYGVLVTKRNAQGIESEVVDNISYEEEQVLGLIDTLSENTVTPVCLVEILDDLMTERMYS